METRTGPQISPVFIDCCDKCSGKGCVVRKRKRRKDDRGWTMARRGASTIGGRVDVVNAAVSIPDWTSHISENCLKQWSKFNMLEGFA